MRKLKDVDLRGKRVLMRVDFNIPMDKEGGIIADAKMKAAFPSIEYVMSHGGRLILMSHLGRPQGRPDESYSLKKIACRLEELLRQKVKMASDSVGEEVASMVENLQPGEVMMLENLRFHGEEEKNDPEYARRLASLGDVYINDAFGTAHRAHASTSGVADYIPAYAGFLMENEVSMLKKVLDYPENPRMAILGGAKITDKIGLIANLVKKLDIILIGGGMANTFLLAQGYGVGCSLCEQDLVGQAASILQQAGNSGTKLLLPIDALVTAEIKRDAGFNTVAADAVGDDMIIADIGPQTIDLFCREISKARTIVWNGPMGIYEYEQFARGTKSIAQAIADSSSISVIGGGDSAAAVQDMGLEKSITHISTGGGATLEFLEGIRLPGVAACEAG